MTLETITAAAQEAFASAREGIHILETVELYHPDWASVFRIVNDPADFTGTLESTAPRDASSAQLFTAFSFSVQLPKKGEVGRQELQLSIDNVSLEIFDLIRSNDASNGAVQVIYRMFISSDLTQPGRVHSMFIKSISVTAQTVTANCVYADHVNRRFPTLDYDKATWPGIFK